MTSRFKLHREDIPEKLYRVHYPDSTTTYDKEDGFLAAYQIDPKDLAPTPGALLAYVERLRKGSSDFSGRYITTFGSKTHALRWARKLQRDHQYPKDSVQVMTIRPMKYKRTPWVASVAAILGDQGHGLEYSADEYLFFRKIARNLIVATEDI
ncbi:hypothetical protein TWF694_002006 [Orbilia ellipsospora]|uniref:DUF7587 domain-containing protein n=1 Tax=Orbilia ellipsospora TaxID=2528407 RepID=A0AAV9X5K6_9PEZI